MWRDPIQNSEVRDVFGAIDIGTPAPFASIHPACARQLRCKTPGNPAWNGTDGFLWDTGEQPLAADEVEHQTMKHPMPGRPSQHTTHSAWRSWTGWRVVGVDLQAVVTLTVGYQPDREPTTTCRATTHNATSSVRHLQRALTHRFTTVARCKWWQQSTTPRTWALR